MLELDASANLVLFLTTAMKRKGRALAGPHIVEAWKHVLVHRTASEDHHDYDIPTKPGPGAEKGSSVWSHH